MIPCSKSLLRNSIKQVHLSRYQHNGISLASALFTENKPIEKPEESTSTNKKQQIQVTVASATDVAVKSIGAGLEALSAVSNRITGLTNSQRKESVKEQSPKTLVRIVHHETLEKRTKALINSVKAASSTLSLTTRIEELSRYLLEHPDANYFTKKVYFPNRNRIFFNQMILLLVCFNVGTFDTVFTVSTTTCIQKAKR